MSHITTPKSCAGLGMGMIVIDSGWGVGKVVALGWEGTGGRGTDSGPG